jgi:hypothetical protein
MGWGVVGCQHLGWTRATWTRARSVTGCTRKSSRRTLSRSAPSPPNDRPAPRRASPKCCPLPFPTLHPPPLGPLSTTEPKHVGVTALLCPPCVSGVQVNALEATEHAERSEALMQVLWTCQRASSGASEAGTDHADSDREVLVAITDAVRRICRVSVVNIFFVDRASSLGEIRLSWMHGTHEYKEPLSILAGSGIVGSVAMIPIGAGSDGGGQQLSTAGNKGYRVPLLYYARKRVRVGVPVEGLHRYETVPVDVTGFVERVGEGVPARCVRSVSDAVCAKLLHAGIVETSEKNIRAGMAARARRGMGSFAQFSNGGIQPRRDARSKR